MAGGDARFEPCVKCGRCLSVCPAFLSTDREELSPRAKAGLFERLLAGEPGVNEARAVELAAKCLGCGRCERACPLGRNPLAMVRLLNQRRPSFAKALAAKVMGPASGPAGTARRLFGRAASSLSRGRVGPFVRVAGRSAPPPVGRAVFFPGCASLMLRPAWATTARSLMAAAGIEEAAAEFSCCGFPKTQAGLAAEAEADARANLDAWRGAGRPVVAVACATCLAGLAAYAERGGLFADRQEQESWTSGLAPLSSLLGGLDFAPVAEPPQAVVFHRPCHDTGVHDSGLVERMFPGRTKAGPDACCGFGGLARIACPDLAASATDRYWRLAGFDPGTVVLSGCTGCALNLGRSAPRGVAAGHWLDAVALG